MAVLIKTQWRLVARSFWLWTLLGFAITPVFLIETENSSTSFNLGPDDALAPLAGFLAAALGVRLFMTEATNPLGMYWRALPLPPLRLFFVKLTSGAAVLGCALVLQLAWIESGLAAWLFDAAWGTSLRETALGDWLVTVGWCAAIYAVTIYFAHAFDHLAASWQAGIPGWFLATGLIARPADQASVIGLDLRAWLAIGAVLGLVCAARLSRTRAVVAGQSFERMRPSPRGKAEAALFVAAQLLLVVIPLVHYSDFRSLWPYLGWSSGTGLAVIWGGLGVLALPWTLRAIRVRGYPVAKAAAIGLVSLTGVGLFAWRAARSRLPDDRRRSSLRVTPLFVLIVGMVVMIAGPALFGGFRWLRSWEIDSGHPDIEIVLGGSLRDRGVARGFGLGASVGTGSGWSSASSGRTVRLDPATGAIAPDELAARLRKDDGSPFAEIPADFHVREILGAEGSIEARYRGLAGEIRRVSLRYERRAFRIGISLELEVHFPAMTELGDRLCTAGVGGLAANDDDLARAASLGDLFCDQFLTERRPRESGRFSLVRADLGEARARRRQVLAIVDAILRRRWDLDAERDADRIRAALAAKAGALSELAPRRIDYAPKEHATELYSELRALALGGPAVRRALREARRAGDLHALLASGFAPDAELFPDALEVWRRGAGERVPAGEGRALFSIHRSEGGRRASPVDSARLIAAWAMLAADRDRAVPLLVEAMDEDTRLVALLGFSRSPAARDALHRLEKAIDAELGSGGKADGDGDLRAWRWRLDEAFAALDAGFEPAEFWDW